MLFRSYVDEDINENITGTTEALSKEKTSKAKQISVNEAKQISLAHAKVAQKDATFVKTELENENNRQVYDIEFYSKNVEYDYEIDAVSGEIISSDFDIEDYSIPVNTPDTQQQTGTNEANGDIGIERAKDIALSHAGLSRGNVSFVKTESDYEDGVKVYDIEFYSANIEYDYEINAVSGAIVSVDRDIENYSIPTAAPNHTEAPAPITTPAPTAAPTQAAPSNISAERAKQIALSHAGVSGASFTKVELDIDDGISVYDIEFKAGNIEYDYEINAANGAIISSNSEVDD